MEKRIAEVAARHRAALNEELRQISPDIVLEMAGLPDLEARDPARFFSDWPDTFSNGGTWYKTWGKGGDRELQPLEELRERIQLARLRGDLRR